MTFPPFQRLVIEGVGLMGGSLGLAARAHGLAQTVVGLGRSRQRLEVAQHMGAIDEIASDAADALAGADALIIGTPPRHIRARWAQLAPLIPHGAFVTDLGSVKAKLVAAAESALPEGVLFIGSHPMAGSEKTGVEFARADFYEGCTCILTPTRRTEGRALGIAMQLWQALGARMVMLTPERHDALLSGISHLPHLVAAAQMQLLGRRKISPRQLAALAGPGLRDATRIAAADPAIWADILSENAGEVGAALDDLIEILTEWRAALRDEENGIAQLESLYREGGEARRPLDQAPRDEIGSTEE